MSVIEAIEDIRNIIFDEVPLKTKLLLRSTNKFFLNHVTYPIDVCEYINTVDGGYWKHILPHDLIIEASAQNKFNLVKSFLSEPDINRHIKYSFIEIIHGKHKPDPIIAKIIYEYLFQNNLFDKYSEHFFQLIERIDDVKLYVEMIVNNKLNCNGYSFNLGPNISAVYYAENTDIENLHEKITTEDIAADTNFVAKYQAQCIVSTDSKSEIDKFVRKNYYKLIKKSPDIEFTKFLLTSELFTDKRIESKRKTLLNAICENIHADKLLDTVIDKYHDEFVKNKSVVQKIIYVCAKNSNYMLLKYLFDKKYIDKKNVLDIFLYTQKTEETSEYNQFIYFIIKNKLVDLNENAETSWTVLYNMLVTRKITLVKILFDAIHTISPYTYMYEICHSLNKFYYPGVAYILSQINKNTDIINAEINDSFDMYDMVKYKMDKIAPGSVKCWSYLLYIHETAKIIKPNDSDIHKKLIYTIIELANMKMTQKIFQYIYRSFFRNMPNSILIDERNPEYNSTSKYRQYNYNYIYAKYILDMINDNIAHSIADLTNNDVYVLSMRYVTDIKRTLSNKLSTLLTIMNNEIDSDEKNEILRHSLLTECELFKCEMISYLQDPYICNPTPYATDHFMENSKNKILRNNYLLSII